METESFECALAGEIGEEHASGEILRSDREHRGAHVAEDPVHASFLVYLETHLGGGHLIFGQAPSPTGAAPIPLTSLALVRVSLPSRNPQPPPVTSTFLAADTVTDRRTRLANVEGCTDLFAMSAG